MTIQETLLWATQWERNTEVTSMTANNYLYSVTSNSAAATTYCCHYKALISRYESQSRMNDFRH